MPSETIRTFIALPVPWIFSLELQSASDKLIGMIGNPLVKAVNFSNLHLTIQFIGDTPPEKLRLVTEIMKGIQLPGRLKIRITDPGFFIKRGHPAVLWFGIEEGMNILGQLHSSLNGELRKSGLVTDSRNFKPHFTVAYIRPGLATEDLQKKISEFQFAKIPEFSAEKLVLFKSTLLRTGAVHDEIYSRKLI